MNFKTNLQCSGCVSKIQNELDKHEGILQWKVDLDSPDKILTVHSKGVTAQEIEGIVQSKGFSIEPIS